MDRTLQEWRLTVPQTSLRSAPANRFLPGAPLWPDAGPGPSAFSVVLAALAGLPGAGQPAGSGCQVQLRQFGHGMGDYGCNRQANWDEVQGQSCLVTGCQVQ